MKEPRNDDERLASLLDGRLVGDVREELLAHLSASEDDRRVFMDTAAVLRELEEAGEDVEDEEDDVEPEEGVIPLRPSAPVLSNPDAETGDGPADGVIPLRSRERVISDAPVEGGTVRVGGRARRRGAVAMWGMLAAVLTGLVLFSWLALRNRAPAGDPVRLAALLEAEEGLPEGWARRPRWDLTRGDSPSAVSGDRATEAARAGALLVDLAVAVEARDAADTRLLAAQILDRFDSRLGGAGPLRQLADRAGAPADSLRPLVEQATERLAVRLGEEPLRLGAWAEAGRLAAHRRDEAFFRASESRKMLESAETLTARDREARAAVARLRAAAPAEGPPDWTALSGALESLLREIAN